MISARKPEHYDVFPPLDRECGRNRESIAIAISPPVGGYPAIGWAAHTVCSAETGPDTVVEEEEGERRAGQGQAGIPCCAFYHGESGYSGLYHQTALKNKKK